MDPATSPPAKRRSLRRKPAGWRLRAGWRRSVRRVRRRFGPRIARRFSQRSPSENALFVLIPVVGLTVGAGALGIAYLIHLVQDLFWGSGSDLLSAARATPVWQRILIPTAGGVLLGLLGLLLRVRMQGHGTAGIMHALALRNGTVSLRKEYPGTASGILTVACGGSLGREGPMVEFGVAASSWLGRRVHLEPQHLRTLVCAAAGAGLAAAYNAPIGGAMFAMEVLMGTIALEVFGPVVIACVVATLISRNAMGDLPRFVIPEYSLVSPWELGGYLLLGVLGGLFSVLLIRMVAAWESFFSRLRVPEALKPILGFGLVGLIGSAYPFVLGNGYETTNLALHEALPLGLFLVLPLAKLLATAVTRAGGGAGGMFTPTLMMGALLGGAFGTFIHDWFPQHTAAPGAYALVGMTAVLSGTTHAPIMAFMMIFEQTDSYQIILPLMFVSIVSNVVSRRIKKESLHVDALLRRGIVLPRGPEAGVMRALRVSNVMHHEVQAVHRSDGFRKVVDAFFRQRINYLYVVDDEGRFEGAIPFHEMKELLGRADSLEAVIALDLVDRRFERVTPEDTLADTMDRFWRQNSERLPVVGPGAEGRLLGWISKRDLIGVYRQEVLGEGQVLSRIGRSDDPEGREDRYVELPAGLETASLEVPEQHRGRSLRELDMRGVYGLFVLQIVHVDPYRGTRSVEMPGPDSVLGAGDRLIVVGPPEGIERFRSRVRVP